jgi:hypothetical protein
MLRKYMVLRAPADANTAATSSDAVDDKGQDSSTEQQAEEQVDSMEEAKPEVETTSEDTATEETEEETSEEQTEEVQKEQEVPAVLDKPEDEKLPFHKEPRFQELIKEKNTYKQELDSIKPQAARAKVLDDFVTTNNIQPQQVQEAFEYLRLLNSDPLKAYAMLKPTYDKLALMSGDRLPDDLQAEVAAGTLSVERAKQLAQTQAQQQYQQWRGASSQQIQAVQHEQAIQGSINAWAQAAQAKDPDFKPATVGAVDGKWEYVDMKLRSLRQANPPRNSQEAVVLVEKAYAEANKFFGSFKQKQLTKKPGLKSQTSQSNASAVVKNPEDVVRAIMSGKRPHQLKYS